MFLDSRVFDISKLASDIEGSKGNGKNYHARHWQRLLNDYSWFRKQTSQKAVVSCLCY